MKLEKGYHNHEDSEFDKDNDIKVLVEQTPTTKQCECKSGLRMISSCRANSNWENCNMISSAAPTFSLIQI